jgi:hypothetical protein
MLDSYSTDLFHFTAWLTGFRLKGVPLLNYTTKIDADKIAQEIAKCLSMPGAQAVMTEYDEKDGYVTAISFKINLDGRPLAFCLPSDWKPVQEILRQQKEKTGNRRIDTSRTGAVGVAWRIVKDWLEAQMALVETQMVTTTQVFLPYAVMKDNKTLFERCRKIRLFY